MSKAFVSVKTLTTWNFVRNDAQQVPLYFNHLLKLLYKLKWWHLIYCLNMLLLSVDITLNKAHPG